MSTVVKQKRVFSGVQPSGKLHLGNYVGALSQWAETQHQYDNIFCVVDLHALTIPEAIKPDELRAKSREVAALYVAAGIDAERCAIFIQSHVSAHAELAWILNCVTPLGWLQRMTQFKSKSEQAASIGTGLLDYPVLQAADILLYDTDFVPVGEDQRQHVELTRDVAQRFNGLFGETFIMPEVVVRASGARIMGLDAPEQKMSKSVGAQRPGHSIGLLDSPGAIKKAVMSAVTDSGSEARFEHASPGVLNLLTIYEVLTKETRDMIEERFTGKGYGFLKKEVLAAIMATLEPIQARYRELTADPDYIETLLEDGADRVRPLAEVTLMRAKQATGLG